MPPHRRLWRFESDATTDLRKPVVGSASKIRHVWNAGNHNRPEMFLHFACHLLVSVKRRHIVTLGSVSGSRRSLACYSVLLVAFDLAVRLKA